MKVIYHNKPYTWLSFKADIPAYPSEKLHLTVKFFGRAEVDPQVVALTAYTIEDRIMRKGLGVVKNMAWRPAKFDTGKYVLEFYRYPPCFDTLHNKFKLVLDQYPIWRPHLTVTEEFTKYIEKEKLRPYDVGLTFGDLELWVGNKGKDL